MKAYFVLCILLASILFFPFSLLARELAAAGQSGGTGKPKPLTPGAGKPGTVPCKGNPYGQSCPAKPPKSSSCKYRRNCPPT